MADPTTTNLIMAQPIRASDVGTWDVPVNGNTGILDQAFGGVTTLALTNTPVTLTTSQAQNAIIRLTGTLTANVAITLPSIYKFWSIDNQLLNSPSSFCATIVSSGGASIIGCPPGVQDIYYDATTVRYKNLGNFGEYWDYAGTTVPTWVTASTIPPYLNCNGTTFSSATYPLLTNFFGGTTLPDSRGRGRAALNQGTSRMTTAGGGVDGNTNFASGGTEGITLGTSQIPSHTHANTLTDPGHSHTVSGVIVAGTAATNTSGGWASGATNTSNNGTGITINNAAQGGGGSHFNVQPTYVGGITMIRAM